ncbi:hypothetical protein Tco_1453547, partial [Tanacetum coccineum]
PELTSAPKDKTSKSTRKSKEGSKSHQKSIDKSAQAEEPIHTDEDLEEPAHQEFNIGYTENQLVDETTQFPDWFQKPAKPPTPARDWNKNVPAAHGPIQSWISNLSQKEDHRESFNELMDTPLDLSAFVLNRLKVDTLSPELLAGPTFKLMKYWNNPEGQQYPHDLCKPLPLIPNSRGRRVIPFDYFINNDLAYLSGGVSSRTYATSVKKTKAADYGHIKWIEDLVPNTMESAHDVYSRNRILAVTKLKIVEWNNYKHLDWITVSRNDDKLYTFKEDDYNRLRLQDIKDMCRKLPKEAQPHKAGYVQIRSQTKVSIYNILQSQSNGTLNDVRSALDDILKQIRMKYLPQTIWRNVDKERAGAMI